MPTAGTLTPTTPPARSSDAVRILVVEDEGILAMDLKRRLEQAGYNVTGTAADSEGAVSAIEREMPDLVLMDIRLRGHDDGVQLAGEVRAKYQLPVIFITAHADAETLERAKLAEPLGYIVKPFAAVSFKPQIEMALWKHAKEQELKAREAWLTATFGNVADALITTDPEGNITLMNAVAAKLTGWDPAEASGRGLLEIFRTFEATTLLPLVSPLDAVYDERTLDSRPVTLLLLDKHGAATLVEAEISTNQDEAGLLGLIVVFRDIAERRRADDVASRLQMTTSLSRLAGGLAEELSRLQGHLAASVQQLGGPGNFEKSHIVGQLTACLRSQEKLLAELSELGPLEPSQSILTDVNATIAGMEGQFKRVLGRCVTLTMHLAPGVPSIAVDEGSFRKNLLRVVMEVKERLIDGGAADIATCTVQDASGERLEISICDMGKSIPSSVRARIFEPCYKARPGGSNPGLSLAAVKHFMEESHGTIEATAETRAGWTNAFTLSFRGCPRTAAL